MTPCPLPATTYRPSTASNFPQMVPDTCAPGKEPPTYDEIGEQILQPAIQKLYAGAAQVGPTLREIKAPLQALVPRELR